MSSSADLYDLTLTSHLVVEQFLLAQGYTSTASQLRIDAAAAGLPLPPLASGEATLDLRQLVETYRSTVRAEERRRKAQQLAATHATRLLTDPLTLALEGPPSLPYRLTSTHSTLHASNILSISHLQLPRRTFDTRTSRYVNTLQACLVTTAADKRIVFSHARTGQVEEILEERDAHQAAVLSVAQDPMDARCLVSCGMDARVIVWDLLTRKPVQVLQEHSKFVVKVAMSETGEYLASIGYDKKVVVYRRKAQTRFVASRANVEEGEEEEDEQEVEEVQGPRYEKVFEMETQTNPEAILFIRAGLTPDVAEEAAIDRSSRNGNVGAARGELVVHQAKHQRTWLCFTVRNDCFIHYIALPTSADSSSSSSSSTISTLTDTLSSTSLCDDDDDINKSATCTAAPDWSVHSFNTNPDMHDLHVSYSLLSLSLHPSSLFVCAQTGDHAQLNSPSRLLLLHPLSSRRAATIFTGVASSSYAVPRHAWLASGRGCWLNAEDGVVRLVDLKGRTRASVLAHGVTAAQGATEEQAAAAAVAATSWSRGGNTIVKDVVVLSEDTVASCGFDRTVRIVSL